MKITGVATIVLNLPMVIDGATPMLGGWARTSIDMLLVRMDTDGGITGCAYVYSQGAPLEKVIREAFTDYLVGENAWDVDRHQEWAAGLETDFPAEIVQRAYSLIDICLWDIRGKALPAPTATQAASPTSALWNGCWLRRIMANAGPSTGSTWSASPSPMGSSTTAIAPACGATAIT